MVVLLIQSLPVFANGGHEPGCPEENLPASGSFSVNEEDTAFFHGSVSVSNLSYHPRTVEEPSWAFISSDHTAYAHHYYTDRSFTVYYTYRLAVVEKPNDPKYESNPKYQTTLDEYDPEEQPMPTPLDHSETLWIDVTDLDIPRGEDSERYHMSAYSRIDVYYRKDGRTKQFSVKDCQNNVPFWHTRLRNN